MANAILDPDKAKYFPEMGIEILNETSVTTAGQSVAQYTLNDRIAILENAEVFTGTALVDMVISADSHERARIRSDVPLLADTKRYNKITAKETLDVTLIHTAGGPTSNIRSRWNLTFRRPLPADKVRDKKQLIDEEKTVSDMTNLEDYISFGIIPYNQSLLKIDPAKHFEDIVPVERKLAAMAASSESIIGGSEISVPNPDTQVLVLLGLMFDTTCFGAGTADDTFIIVDRDNDPTYMKIDVTGMPDNLYMPCYIPAIKKLKVYVSSATGTGGNTVPCGFTYGVRPLNVADYIRWGLKPASTKATLDMQNLIKNYPETAQRLKAGMI